MPQFRISSEGDIVSDLVVVGFKGEDTADQVLNKLREMQKEYLIDLEDACVAVRDKNGKVRLKQAINLIGTGALGVKRQEVIAGRFESGHGRNASDALMRAVPVVVMDPGIELISALEGVLVDEAIGPLA